MGLSEQDQALIERVRKGRLGHPIFPADIGEILNAARAEATEAQARRIGELEAMLSKVTSELEEEIQARVGTVSERSIHRDMQTVHDARALLPTDTKESSDDS